MKRLRRKVGAELPLNPGMVSTVRAQYATAMDPHVSAAAAIALHVRGLLSNSTAFGFGAVSPSFHVPPHKWEARSGFCGFAENARFCSSAENAKTIADV